MFILREYQQKASDNAVAFFNDNKAKYNAIEVLPTGSGKSLVLADIAARLDGRVLIFQPSKEILQQNFAKYNAIQPYDCSVYSASVGQKEISKVTFATIGSAIGHKELFQQFKYVLVDECHLVNPKQGMYKDFFEALGDTKILGVTATPYRLSSSRNYGSMLKFITRTRPAIFKKVIYQVQISTLLDMGYLSKLDYFPMNPLGWNELNLQVNTTGADYTDKSIVREYERIDFYSYLVSIVNRLLNPKSGVKRKGILVFTRFLKEAEQLARTIPGCAIVSGDTPKQTRELILKQFKQGIIKVVANVGVLTCLSEDTEILTRNKGWVKMGNMEMSDMVAQYNQLDEAISFTNPIRIMQNDNFKEDFVEVEGRYTNFLVTHNHKMLYCKRARNGLGAVKKCNASDIVGKKVFIPVSSNAKADIIAVEQEKRCSDKRFIATNSYNFRKKGLSHEESIRKAKELLERRNKMVYKNPNQLTIDECRFIGFWLGDGCRYKVASNGERFSITQSLGTPLICEWIEHIMDECGIYYTKSDHEGGETIINGRKCKVNGYRQYNLAKGTGGDGQQVNSNLYPLLPYLQKRGTDLYWGLNKQQYFAMMEGLFKADGWHGNDIPYNGQKIIGEHKDLFDLLQAIGVCRGYRVTISPVKKREFNKKQLYNISLFDKTFHGLTNDVATLKHNTEKKSVWCVSMPLGNIITRRNGKVTIMGNCGFDYPELDTIVMARPTMSLALWYQIVGRAIRPHPDKESGWIVDLCGNIERFGEVKDLRLEDPSGRGLWQVTSKGRQLTNVYF